MDIRYITALMAAALAAAPLSAQDLNPTVNVTNTYKGKLMEVTKKQLPMEVPDSVMRFDYLFDYSVISTPYRGAGDFSPYAMNLNPQASTSNVNRLYLNAGAGYLLNPELDFVWSPLVDKRFSFSLYDHLDGFYGRTKNLGFDDSWRIVKSGMQDAPTLDLTNRLGGSGRYDFSSSVLKFDLGYGIIATRDSLLGRFYNSADASVQFKSKDFGENQWLYDASIRYTYGSDHSSSYESRMGENILGARAEVGYAFGLGRLTGTVGYDLAAYNGFYNFTNSLITAGVRYEMRFDKALVSAGFKGTTNPSAPVTEGKVNQMAGKGFKQPLYPDVYASYSFLHDALTVYASADGGRYMHTYNSLVSGNRHVSIFSASTFYDNCGLLMDNTDQIRLSAGLRGRVLDYLNYNAKVGYDFYRNALLDAVYVTTLRESGSCDIFEVPRYCVNYGDYNLFHVDLTAAWKSKHVDVDGTFTFQSSDMAERELLALAPSKFKFNARASYNWADRIHAGLQAEFASKRTQQEYISIPAYFDLGIYADYSFSSKLSFWVKGGNLLNQTIMRSPVYAESGINFTAGITLKL